MTKHRHGDLETEECMHGIQFPAEHPVRPEAVQGEGKQGLDYHDGCGKKLVLLRQGKDATARKLLLRLVRKQKGLEDYRGLW